MPNPGVVDKDGSFRKAWHENGCSPAKVAKSLGIALTSVYAKRARLARTGIRLPTVSTNDYCTGANAFGNHDWQIESPAYQKRIHASLVDGYAVIFSDAHFWPGIRSLAFEALLIVLKELKPRLVISNGDCLDGASISRHDPLGWQKLPKVIEELDAAKSFLWEIEKAVPKARKIFVAGNHDTRFDRRLASEVSEFEDVPGMRLQDHLKGWEFCYSVLINEDTDPSYVVHNVRGGTYAPRNNVLAAGCTTFTGHLHSQKSLPVTTLLHEWDGVDCGMVADRDGPQFSYISSRPVDWREGFAVQRYDKDGLRYPAELLRVVYHRKKRRAVFRGKTVLERNL